MNLTQYRLLAAAQWLERQKYLKLEIKKGVITITDGVNIEAKGKDLADAVETAQDILITMQINKSNKLNQARESEECKSCH